MTRTIDDFLRLPFGGDGLPLPAENPWAAEDGLAFAAITAIAWDFMHSRVVLALDCRYAAREWGGNAAVLILDGVAQFTWNDDECDDRAMWRAVETSSWTRLETNIRVDLGVGWMDSLTFTARRATFVSGTVPGLPEEVLSFPEATSEQILAETVQMSSDFVPRHAATIP